MIEIDDVRYVIIMLVIELSMDNNSDTNNDRDR